MASILFTNFVTLYFYANNCGKNYDEDKWAGLYISCTASNHSTLVTEIANSSQILNLTKYFIHWIDGSDNKKKSKSDSTKDCSRLDVDEKSLIVVEDAPADNYLSKTAKSLEQVPN